MNTIKAERKPVLTLGREIPGSNFNVRSFNLGLSFWISQFPERGSTWYAANQLGDAYVTFYIRFGINQIKQALHLFKRDIEKEIYKTGIVSIRRPPKMEIQKNEQELGKRNFLALSSRIVAYRGNIYDSIIPPEEWHKMH